ARSAGPSWALSTRTMLVVLPKPRGPRKIVRGARLLSDFNTRWETSTVTLGRGKIPAICHDRASISSFLQSGGTFVRVSRFQFHVRVTQLLRHLEQLIPKCPLL